MYSSVRKDGHRIVELLRKPVGESSLPAKFVIRTRHVKELLESLFDEHNWLDEQWERRHAALKQARNLHTFRSEAQKVFTWVADVGNRFLSLNTSIGSDSRSGQRLLKSHDTFDSETEQPYGLSQKLFSQAQALAESGDCQKKAIEREAEQLKKAVHEFASRLDDRREIILHAFDFFQKSDLLSTELEQLNLPIPREHFTSAPGDIVPRLEGFREQRKKMEKRAEDVFESYEILVEAMEKANKLSVETGCPVSYSEGVATADTRLSALKQRQQEVTESCDRRELRWDLTLQMDGLQRDVSHHLEEVESWASAQASLHWEPAENTMVAQSSLDSFQQELTRLTTAKADMVSKAKRVVEEVNELDVILFGRADPALPAARLVEAAVLSLEAAAARVESVSLPRVAQLQDCLQFHLLHQRANKLNIALASLSTSISLIVGVGASLQSAQLLQQQVAAASEKFQAVSKDCEAFTLEVEECLARSHYEATSLGLLVRNMRERQTAVSKAIAEKEKLLHSSIEFHQNTEMLNSAMEKCQAQFNSRDTGHSVEDARKLLKTLEELRSFIEQAAEVVVSQGKKLVTTCAAAAPLPGNTEQEEREREESDENGEPRKFHSPQPSRRGSDPTHSFLTLPPKKKWNSSDLLQSDIEAISEEARERGTSLDKDSIDSPRLLVPRRRSPRAPIKAPVKAALSVSSGLSGEAEKTDGPAVAAIVEDVETRLQYLKRSWKTRRARLLQAQKVIAFNVEAPAVLEWIGSTGAKFLATKNNYGRSIEEVETMIEKYHRFQRKEKLTLERAQDLRASYRSMEQSGHSKLNEVRGVATELEEKWAWFEEEMKHRLVNLEMALKFQRTLFQASNWCQKSQQFLSSTEEKVGGCDRSPEVARLIEELEVYLTATGDRQTEQVTLLQHISTHLHSNLLSETANHIEQTTNQTMADYDQCKTSLEKLHARLVQIEGERDRELQLTKQRERVLEELLSTEQAFVADLRLIVEKCRPRFVSELMPNSLKGKESIIFSNISEIAKFHREYLLPQLREFEGDLEGTAQIFVECADRIAAIYVPYCKSKTASEDLLASHRSYLSRMQTMFGTDVPLSSLLIKPVQRITKYPLLLRDALKYTHQLKETSQCLEDAVRAVDKIPVETNNAIHFGHLQGLEEADSYGHLLCQGLLLVYEPRFGLKTEKERQVFVFGGALIFARKVDLGQAKFKYEYKFKISVSPRLQVVEFFEGDPCRFGVTAGDHRINLKASSIEVKQEWVKSLRIAVLNKRPPPLTNIGGKVEGKMERNGDLLHADTWPTDLRGPSPAPPSPLHSAAPGINGRGGEGEMFERYVVTEDFTAEGEQPLRLAHGDVVEVLDDSLEGKWFVRRTGPPLDHGWVPPDILEPVEGTDYGTAKKKWVQVTTGPLNTTNNDKLRKQRAFGSHDIQSQQVISALKTLTSRSLDQAEVGEALIDELTSLDNPGRRRLDSNSMEPAPSRVPPPQPATPTNLIHPEVEIPSPQPATPTHPEVELPPDAEELVRLNTGTSKQFSRESDWKKSRWRRGGIRRRGATGESVSSDRSDSPSEKMMGDVNSASSDEEKPPEDSVEVLEMPSEENLESVKKAEETVRKAEEKMKYIMMEVLETEVEYVKRLEECIEGYVHEMHGASLPETLKGKEKVIFGNIQAVYEFHHKTFKGMIEAAKDSVEETAKCFVDQAGTFNVYVTYCENKSKSESFLWTYQHGGGTFFEEAQQRLGYRHGIASYLIKPVQRITKYQLLLRDLHKSAGKAGMETPNLVKALEVMQNIPKRANDAMALSMIVGYEGNIHANGEIILHDEFTVYERSRWTAGHRHIFLLDQRLIITKEKDGDGMYVYKDSLKVHSLSVAEKEGDNPARFAVGTGPIGTWDQYYVLEALSVEKKEHWVAAIKGILKQQFELLKALKTPKAARSQTLDPKMSVAMIPDSEEEDEDEGEDTNPVPPHSPLLLSPWDRRHSPAARARAQTLAEVTPLTPTLKPRLPNLYTVAQDCAPPKDNEGILFIHKGEVYDVLDDSSDWWFAHLVRHAPTGLHGNQQLQGWVPGSFLDRFVGELEEEEEEALRLRAAKSKSSKSPRHRKKHSSPRPQPRLSIVSSYSYHSGSEEEEESWLERAKNERKEEEREKGSGDSGTSISTAVSGKPPRISTFLTNETVMVGRNVQFRCVLMDTPPDSLVVQWTKDERPLNIDRAFTGVNDCTIVLKITAVEREDGGLYLCSVHNSSGHTSSAARLTVLCPPCPPSRPLVKPLTSSSISLSWLPPSSSGNCPVSLYIIECKDVVSDRWSTIMKRITEPSTVISDLVPGLEYVFRVVAGNTIGSSEPSEESRPVRTAFAQQDVDFSLDPFDDYYELGGVIGRGQFSVMYECTHTPTQQTYAAKLTLVAVGQEYARTELTMLARISHPNIVQMISGYLNEQHFVILFPLIHGLNLFEFIAQQDSIVESTAVACVEQVLSALCYLHDSSIVFLGLQHEHILTVEREASAIPDVKLIHFERARETTPDNTASVATLMENFEYEAPEVLCGEPVSTATDMWSLGVLLYTLLGGVSPFLVDSLDLSQDNIRSARYSFPPRAFGEVSESAKDMVSKLLLRDPSARLTGAECLSHSWLSSPSPQTSPQTSSQTSPSLSVTRLKDYCSSRKWQNSLLMPSELAQR